LKAQLRTVFLVAAAFLVCDSSIAQEADLRRLNPPAPSQTQLAATTPNRQVIHVSDKLSQTPEAREGMLKYIEARDAGLLSARKGGRSFDIGEEKSFNLLRNLHEEETSWITRTFILRATNDVANVWIEESLDSTVSDAQLQELDEHILHSTPERSFRPDKGIIENDNYLFGAPPNVDGDGKVDLLLHDIEEGEGGAGNILGYVTSADLNPEPSENHGNAADILYVDIKEGLHNGVPGLGWIIAHEYQHLIHFAYQDAQDWRILTPELSFVNEGLSEWASIINGYFDRRINYLNKIEEHGTPLMDWDTETDLYDYERAGLFTTYIADRIGPEATGSIVRAVKQSEFGESYAVGADGYDVVLSAEGTSLSEIIPKFHVANFVNDTSIDLQYGYALQERQDVAAIPTTSVDGSAKSSSDFIDLEMHGGAVQYISWTDVANLSLHADVHSEIAPALIEFYRPRIALRMIAEHVDGSRTIETVNPQEGFQLFSGDFSRVTLAVMNSSGAPLSSIRIDVNAHWNEVGESGFFRHAESYDDGRAVEGFYYGMPDVARFASKFAVPTSSRLAEVQVAPVYDTDFSNSDAPEGSPRDFRLHVWSEDADGYPGEELFRTDVTEAPSTRHINFATRAFSFLDIALPDTSSLANLGDSVFVGISNIGSDINYLVLTPSTAQAGEDVSYLYYDFENGEGWAPLSKVTQNDEEIFAGMVYAIRVEYIVATSVDAEDEAELPLQISLEQNYPNPFNPSTSISYSLPEAMRVRLAVYDALGRLVTTITEGVQTAGRHEASLSADGWASGVYFYMLETETRTVSKPMILMK